MVSLPPKIQEQEEKLKKEALGKRLEMRLTLDKLKQLGNSILGVFGMSLDNFQVSQDPKTGSYSFGVKK